MVRPGYKQTEVGVIPEDWEIKTIGDIADVKTGPFGSALHERDYVEDGTPIITVEHLGERGVEHVNLPMVSEEDLYRLKAYSLNENDVVFSRVGSIDRNALIRKEEAGWLFSGRLLRVRLRGNKNHAPYLSYHFHSEPFKQRVKNVAVGQTMPSLNTQILNGIQVVLSTTKEQCAIAEALSDVDALINALDKLIAKKRAIKTAAMQELLTGRKRLPGFGGEWKEKRIAELAEVDPENLTANTKPDYQFKYISLDDVDEGALKNYSEKTFNSAPSRARRVLRKGDVLLSTVRPNLQSHFLFDKDEEDWICSTGFAVIRCLKQEAYPAFVYFHLFSGIISKQIETLISGSNYPAINSSDVRDLMIPVPEVDEQKAIAVILSDMDAEITALEARHAKTQALKQGIMQELLTGQTRLVQPAGGH